MKKRSPSVRLDPSSPLCEHIRRARSLSMVLDVARSNPDGLSSDIFADVQIILERELAACEKLAAS